MSVTTTETKSSGSASETVLGSSRTGGLGFEPHTKWRYHPLLPFFLSSFDGVSYNKAGLP